MKLTNKTHYRTDDLRRFMLAGIKAEGMDPKFYRVEVGYRTSRRWGQGSYYTGWFSVLVPRDGISEHNRFEMAETLRHEIAHNRGIRHKDMADRFCGAHPDDPTFAWVRGLVIREKEMKSKVKRDLPAEREAHARAMLDKHERKQKRTAKLVKKWRAKVRYYERRSAAATPKGESLRR